MMVMMMMNLIGWKNFCLYNCELDILYSNIMLWQGEEF